VIIGNSGAEQAVRCPFSAYDAETGKRVWRFYTVPGDPSKPFEHPKMEMAAKTWTGEWWKMGGGGNTGMRWPTIPMRTFSTLAPATAVHGRMSTAAPEEATIFSSRLSSRKTRYGKMVWYFQKTPGDDWDYTSVQPIILADLTINGRQRKVLMHAPKNGFFFVLDRITGEFIAGDKYVKRVTWATGLDSKGRPIEAKGARAALNDPVLISPAAPVAHTTGNRCLSGRLLCSFTSRDRRSNYTYRIDPNF
jgi:glucose dehydrogenase